MLALQSTIGRPPVLVELQPPGEKDDGCSDVFAPVTIERWSAILAEHKLSGEAMVPVVVGAFIDSEGEIQMVDSAVEMNGGSE